MERNLDEGNETRHLNCWEFMSCGRERGGKHFDGSCICPACTDRELDKVHGGENAGRACWVVAGTLSRGSVSCKFAGDYITCADCPFYKLVRNEEGKHFWSPKLLHRMLATGRS